MEVKTIVDNTIEDLNFYVFSSSFFENGEAVFVEPIACFRYKDMAKAYLKNLQDSEKSEWGTYFLVRR